MRRADRLFQIVQILRHRRLTTAQQLADRLEVSVRTVYRDIQDLCLSGVPIEGEAGVGYLLRQEANIPPLMFNEAELEAIQVGMRMVETWGGKSLGSAARQALIKVEAVLPERLRGYHSLMFSPDFYIDQDEFKFLDPLRLACQQRHPVLMNYRDAEKQDSERQIHPLAIYFWRGTWTLLSWCLLRNAFRNFRVDRIQELTVQVKPFPVIPGQELSDYIAQMEAKYEEDCSFNLHSDKSS
ncbi:YafY family transcriptional regulator [Shewanella corallii]|uniref:YafY family transcriptional regulator n=1 Tax=Shewanella corallii TaxID=560080 RepID=A0ABT0N451_9GAMM|nr:YafY family protein [Shewanella corallii]MCL2913212.1 YafY family transcriptional regulator [Shewanella corallii]